MTSFASSSTVQCSFEIPIVACFQSRFSLRSYLHLSFSLQSTQSPMLYAISLGSILLLYCNYHACNLVHGLALVFAVLAVAEKLVLRSSFKVPELLFTVVAIIGTVFKCQTALGTEEQRSFIVMDRAHSARSGVRSSPRKPQGQQALVNRQNRVVVILG